MPVDDHRHQAADHQHHDGVQQLEHHQRFDRDDHGVAARWADPVRRLLGHPLGGEAQADHAPAELRAAQLLALRGPLGLLAEVRERRGSLQGIPRRNTAYNLII